MSRLFAARDLLFQAKNNLASPPQWARTPDATLDCSDEWRVATDPQCTLGECCTAYFDDAQVWVERAHPDPSRYSEGWEYAPVLKGVRVKGGSGGDWTNTYLDRAEIQDRLGSDWIDEVDRPHHHRSPPWPKAARGARNAPRRAQGREASGDPTYQSPSGPQGKGGRIVTRIYLTLPDHGDRFVQMWTRYHSQPASRWHHAAAIVLGAVAGLAVAWGMVL